MVVDSNDVGGDGGVVVGVVVDVGFVVGCVGCGVGVDVAGGVCYVGDVDVDVGVVEMDGDVGCVWDV